ncbi:tautomerase family protein [Clostridium sp. 19966]|uniref:phenylpyruvate tautomerase MIF-related protein n=1 Tax=Clostridium sp. 19966 TaxID=2768166 RepID=UPI0028DFE1CD|nr:phenylpyruvate tautomerase MIF-related protein [Clostridium sp. 19966]MDT8718747.1 tautomerase family protein [Clostridium sp. 19966]
MPYINCVTPLKLEEDKKEKLKTAFGRLIENLPGKTEEWLFVGFNDGQSLYFKGEKQEKAAIVEIKIFGSADKKHKDKLTAEICDLLSEELEVQGSKIYVVFYEVSDGNWGWNGGLF